jgi:hypothetical protein
MHKKGASAPFSLAECVRRVPSQAVAKIRHKIVIIRIFTLSSCKPSMFLFK